MNEIFKLFHESYQAFSREKNSSKKCSDTYMINVSNDLPIYCSYLGAQNVFGVNIIINNQ